MFVAVVASAAAAAAAMAAEVVSAKTAGQEQAESMHDTDLHMNELAMAPAVPVGHPGLYTDMSASQMQLPVAVPALPDMVVAHSLSLQDLKAGMLALAGLAVLQS